MGRDYVEFRVVARLSKHNTEQDEIDETTWEALHKRVVELCDEPQYEDISVMVV